MMADLPIRSSHSSHPVQDDRHMPIFENYFKMARLNLTQSEVLDKCLIPAGAPTTEAMVSSTLLDGLLDLNGDTVEVDEESFLQELDGDSDFSDTVSDFSSLCLSNSKLKSKKKDRWIRARQKKNEFEKYYDIHKISSKDKVNHKTIVMQHESDDYHDEPLEHRSNTQGSSKFAHNRVVSPKSVHSRSASPKLAARTSASPRSVRSKSASPKPPHNGSASPKSVRQHSVSPKSDRQSKTSPKANRGGVVSSSSTSHESKCSSKDMYLNSWSAPIEDERSDDAVTHSSDDVTLPSLKGHRSRSKKKRKNSKRSVSRGTSSTNKDCDERNLGRNMRAVPSKKCRKLRT